VINIVYMLCIQLGWFAKSVIYIASGMFKIFLRNMNVRNFK